MMCCPFTHLVHVDMDYDILLWIFLTQIYIASTANDVLPLLINQYLRLKIKTQTVLII